MKTLLILLFVFVTAAAQPQTPKDKERVRRQQARSLLIALSTDARAFHDQTLRARSLARIADALWTVEAEQGRLMFRKAWEAAEIADRESDLKLQEDIRQQQAKTGRSGYALSLPPSLRRECCDSPPFASKIEDTEVRKEFQAYMDGQLVNYHVQKKQADPALEIIRKGDITHLHRAWALTQIARFLVKTDRETALQLIEEAANEARRIDVADAGRPRGLVAVANALREVDPPRMWDATFDAVKAANSAEGFTGEDGELLLQFQSKHQSSVNTNDVPEFDLEGLFKELANQDYERAVELARGFEREGPRAVATISIARAVLEPKKK